MNKNVRSPRYVIELAREMRINLTPSEKILWNELRNRKIKSYKFRCQHPVYRYILDFYCHKAKLAIEIDGNIHKKRKDYDDYRDEFLKSIDIETIRFSNIDILQNLSHVLKKIEKRLKG